MDDKHEEINVHIVLTRGAIMVASEQKIAPEAMADLFEDAARLIRDGLAKVEFKPLAQALPN